MINVKYCNSNKIKCEQAIQVTFKYKSYIVDVIRTILPRYWDITNKIWYLPYDSLSYLKESLPREEFKIFGKPINNKKYREKKVSSCELPKTLKSVLYDYQKRSYYECMAYNKYLLLLDQGLGKSIIALTTIIRHKELKHINNCLVLVGVSDLKYTWQEEAKKHFGLDISILGNRYNHNGYWTVPGNKEKLQDLKEMKHKYFIYVTNIESLRDKEILKQLKKMFKKKVFDCIIVDEIHKCKSVSSQQGRALLSLSKMTPYFYGMTGTIIVNNPLDLYLPLKCVGKEEHTFASFKNYYCVFGGFKNYAVVGYKHLDELQASLSEISIRFKKSDVLQLPPKNYITEYVEMSKKQRKLYIDVQNVILNDIDNVIMSPNPLSQITRLRQATMDTSLLSTTVKESAKFNRAEELIDAIVNNGESVVVYSELASAVDNFYNILCKKYKVAKITGKTKDKKGQLDLFLKDNDCHIIIGTKTIQTGYTLTKATTAIFLDESGWTNAQKEQASDRIYRIGQSKSVNIVTLICKDTIDEYVHKLVHRKKIISDTLVDNVFNLRDKEVLKYIITGKGELNDRFKKRC